MVEDLKKLKSNISVMDLCRIPQQKDLLLQALDEDGKLMLNLSPNSSEGKGISGEIRKPNVNTITTDKKPRSSVPPFLLTFEIYNKNLHNCLVESGASSNVMPLSVCKKLNSTPTKNDTHIIQLDRTEVKVIGGLKDVMIWIVSNPKFHQVIDIIIVDIPEAYGMLLSRDWSEKLHGYFSTDWSHL
jgi:hypothetical protein